MSEMPDDRQSGRGDAETTTRGAVARAGRHERERDESLADGANITTTLVRLLETMQQLRTQQRYLVLLTEELVCQRAHTTLSPDDYRRLLRERIVASVNQ
jgi:hypothetical protein